MSADFDWSGAPEGERWVVAMHDTCHYVITANNEVFRFRLWYSSEPPRWGRCATDAGWIRENGTRVESARPVLRADDRVEPGDIVEVTYKGCVTEVDQHGHFSMQLDDQRTLGPFSAVSDHYVILKPCGRCSREG